MIKPTKDELKHALHAAEYMREHNMDKHHMAKSLLYMAERNKMLEKVLGAAELYLHFGQGSTEHATLMRAINAARRTEERNQAAALASHA